MDVGMAQKCMFSSMRRNSHTWDMSVWQETCFQAVPRVSMFLYYTPIILFPKTQVDYGVLEEAYMYKLEVFECYYFQMDPNSLKLLQQLQ